MGNPTIPNNFLPPEAPPNVSSRRIDFTQTNPPLPGYAKYFAAVIDDILTPAECGALIDQAEASTTTNGNPSEPIWERAMINIGSGKQALATDTRNCGRIIHDSPELASRLLARLQPFLRSHGLDTITDDTHVAGLRGRGKTYKLTRLNERLRFLKYEGEEYFRPHWDGRYTTPDGGEMSLYTIHVYLNGAGEQDLSELESESQQRATDATPNADVQGTLLGGATSFIPRYEEKETQVRVFPRTGSVLVFQQNGLMHGGDPVVRGTKYTLRTDVMYAQV
ncbi:P4Hc [Aspergillus sp. HF37]|nr:P4Hc [Aspergillus sp. HF37]